MQIEIEGALPLAVEHLQVFAHHLHQGFGTRAKVFSTMPGGDEQASGVQILLDGTLPTEAYFLTIGPTIQVRVSHLTGLAHATATLLQLWSDVGQIIPAMEIHDAPANPYRSLMLDLGRNPHSLGLLEETIDLLWFCKVASLHLHLTDDQRFAFPSRAFPRLASTDGAISWEEWVALERYAVVRGVTLIPELEAPGHGTLLRRHYPEVFGTTPTELASLPSARAGLKVLLDEMMEVFASTPYVHVGGDEAYGVPADLQRSLVNDLQGHLAENGRTAVVWEGPPLGEGKDKVSTEVLHMNWRTIDFPADAMLEAGYPVINAAWDPLYVVGHYPRNNFTMAAPGHIYRTLDRFRFRHFNPDIPTFSDPVKVAPTDRVLGYCMPWWEGREQHFLPLVVVSPFL